MLVNEKRINKRGKAMKNGRMELNIRVNILVGKSMGKGYCILLMGVNMRGIFIIMILMGLEFIVGRMGDHILGNGSIIKCMEKVLLHGRMEGNMRAVIRRIKSMGMVYLLGLFFKNTKNFLNKFRFFLGLMVDNIKEIGIKANNMVKENIY